MPIKNRRREMEGMYVNGDIDRRLEGLRDWMEEKDDGVMIGEKTIGGDFNARTEEEGT